MHTMAGSTTNWTAERVRALPDDGKRYEVLDGELLVTPAPRGLHQRALQELYLLLAPWVRGHGLGEAWMSPADIEFNPRRMVQPDLFVIRLVAGKATHEWPEMPRRLMLTVEALSPSTQRTDRVSKRAVYMEEGVPEYWIIDIDGRVIERWTQGNDRPEVLGETLEWQPVTGIPPFIMDLDAYFSLVIDGPV